MWKSNMLFLLISTKKLYFGDNYAIYDVILQEPIWKRHYIYKNEYSRDPFTELLVFSTYSIVEKPTGPILPF